MRITTILTATLLFPLCGAAVEARPVLCWTMERLAAKADVLVVAKVLDVTRVGEARPHEQVAQMALLDMAAKLRVLRAWDGTGGGMLKRGDLLRLPYRTVDWEDYPFGPLMNAPRLPHLSVGEVLAFPLRRAVPGNSYQWGLLAEEDCGLLVPCAREEPAGVRTEGGAAFLRSELAGAFANGRDQDILRAARYVNVNWPATDVDTLHRLVEDRVGSDEERWLRIGVICHCAKPAAPLVKLLAGDAEAPDPPDPLPDFAARALRHVSRADFDQRFIAEAFRQAALQPYGYGVGKALAQSYSHHPTTRKLLRQRLEADRPEAVTIACCLIQEKHDPLVPVAVAAARQLLLRGEGTGLGEAWQLMDRYGTEGDLALVLSKMRVWQKTDYERYRRLWRSSGTSARLRIPVVRIVIEDKRVFAGDVRFCDDATLGLQVATKVDFGLSVRLLEVPLPESRTDRDTAVERAKAWLTAHHAGEGAGTDGALQRPQ